MVLVALEYYANNAEYKLSNTLLQALYLFIFNENNARSNVVN